MRTIAVASQKGGSGKTTICLNLAVYAEQQGQATAVLDLDPQASAAEWRDRRAEDEAPNVWPAQASRLPKIIEGLRHQGAGLVLIDTPPSAEAATRAAVRAADLVLVPCRPSSLDLHAILETVRTAQAAQRAVWVVLNAIKAGSPADAAAARAFLSSQEVPVAPVALGDRVAYSRPLAAGRSAVEDEPGGAAAQEIIALWEWISGQLGGVR